MQRIIPLILHAGCLLGAALLALTPEASSQEADRRKEEERRRQAIEEILRLQDLRTPFDARLLGLLGDRDPLVRERAVLAYGSLQDSMRLDQLAGFLLDPSIRVQNAAAFAIGQTAAGLGPGTRARIQEDILWNRLSATGAAERMIEEMGKFGTEEGLRQILLRFAATDPPQYPGTLSLTIARFAIRGLVIEEGVKFLLRRCHPVDATTWETVYALQRIGDHPLIRQDGAYIALLHLHRDPLIRMNLAVLLGKIHDDRSGLEPLLKLAEFDPDWRVRVNALRGLASFDTKSSPVILRTFRRCAYDGNPLIASAAFTAAASSNAWLKDSTADARELKAAVTDVALNKNQGYHMQVQSEAALALSKLLRGDAFAVLASCDRGTPFLQGQILRAVGETGSAQALELLAESVSNDEPPVVCGALDGLQSLVRINAGDSAITVTAHTLALKALASSDVAVVATAATLLRDHRLLRPSSVRPLSQKLNDLRVPDDIEAMQEIARTLGALQDSDAIPHLELLLDVPDLSVAREAASALAAITGRDYSRRIVRRSEPLYTDYDFKYLESLPPFPSVAIETIRGTIHVELDRDAAPFTVLSFLKLAAQRGFYRGRTFHRVVPNFVIQGGDPRGDGWGGPGYTIRSEFSPNKYETGSLGIASAGKDTEGSQFFITHSPQPHLDGRYTIFGRVTGGQDVVDRILIGDRIIDVKLEPETEQQPR